MREIPLGDYNSDMETEKKGLERNEKRFSSMEEESHGTERGFWIFLFKAFFCFDRIVLALLFREKRRIHLFEQCILGGMTISSPFDKFPRYRPGPAP